MTRGSAESKQWFRLMANNRSSQASVVDIMPISNAYVRIGRPAEQACNLQSLDSESADRAHSDLMRLRSVSLSGGLENRRHSSLLRPKFVVGF